eukprot:TRINITY_DN21000_c0_g1_i1.p1 TRINITY_DN21000_c0_g1~~TRINITY_DN21000_c0_g1_i1.p1  ORF type:complete len:119 (-),score=15.53 TRINITY_DN21000_c0_g1_i1:176-499(-)
MCIRVSSKAVVYPVLRQDAFGPAAPHSEGGYHALYVPTNQLAAQIPVITYNAPQILNDYQPPQIIVGSQYPAHYCQSSFDFMFTQMNNSRAYIINSRNLMMYTISKS